MRKGITALITTVTAALLLTACSPGGQPAQEPPATEIPAPPSATPDPEPIEDPAPPSFDEDELREALLTAEDLSAHLTDVEVREGDAPSADDAERTMIAGDDACRALFANEHQVDDSEAVRARLSFEWAEGVGYNVIRTYRDVDELLTEKEAFLELMSECRSAVVPGTHNDVTEEYRLIAETDLDPRYLDLGDGAIVRTIAYSTEDHGVYAIYTIVEVHAEHLLTTVGVSSPEGISDDAILSLAEKAAANIEALLAAA